MGIRGPGLEIIPPGMPVTNRDRIVMYLPHASQYLRRVESRDVILGQRCRLRPAPRPYAPPGQVWVSCANLSLNEQSTGQRAGLRCARYSLARYPALLYAIHAIALYSLYCIGG